MASLPDRELLFGLGDIMSESLLLLVCESASVDQGHVIRVWRGG
jgi:hypothetical protein